MIAGQADDIAFETRINVSIEQCMAMSAGKTGALLGCASSIGAVLAGAPDATVGALRDFGTHLGLAFQAVDDLLGIWGDPERTGKPAGSDLRQRKKTLPVVAALASGADEAIELRGLLSDGHLDEAQVERAVALVEACGARSWTANRAKAHMDTALGALNRVRMNPLAHRELSDLAAFVVERES
jgi:geranylgeranyl diphosphate synthase, type I